MAGLDYVLELDALSIRLLRMTFIFANGLEKIGYDFRKVNEPKVRLPRKTLYSHLNDGSF